MRLVHVSTSTIPSTEANAVQVVRMADAFASLGHDVTLVARRGEERLDDPAAYFGLRHDPDLRLLRASDLPFVRSTIIRREVRQLLRAADTDLVYGRNAGVLASLRRRSPPIIYESHTPPLSRRRFAIETRLFAGGSCALLVVISQALRRRYEAAFGKALPPVLVAPDAATPVPEAELATERRPGSWRVGYVGSPYKGRGLATVLSIAAALPDIEVHIVGASHEQVGRFGSVGPNVVCWGRVPPGRVGATYRDLDVLLAPYERAVTVAGEKVDSSEWMSPLKIFEYLAAARPVIASDLPVLREVLDEDIAVLVPPDVPERWIEAVQSLLEDEARRQSIAIAGWQAIVDRWSWDRRASDILNAASTTGTSI